MKCSLWVLKGKEFARIVDLLLFHEARRAWKKITIFNDASGDYFGLDSFEGDSFRKSGTTGYQYKFYPSPLKSDYHKEILKSLKNTAENQKKLKLKKWILVTPQDLIESASRKEGGDDSWFEGLRKNMGLKFELEHWGHKKILSLYPGIGALPPMFITILAIKVAHFPAAVCLFVECFLLKGFIHRGFLVEKSLSRRSTKFQPGFIVSMEISSKAPRTHTSYMRRLFLG